MSHPRPDPPRLAAIREAYKSRGDDDAGAHWNGCDRFHPECAIQYLLTERDALLSDLRTLEAQWRKQADVQSDDWAWDAARSLTRCADDLAALLARLEGR
jgi:hypothetical protein